MIRCDDARDRWHRQYDDGGQDELLDGHLAGCAECRRYADEMRGVAGLLDELRDAGEHVVATGRAAARPRRAVEPRLIRLVRYSRAAAVLAIVAGAAFYFAGGHADRGRFTGVSTPGDAPAVSFESKLGITLRDQSAERMMAVAVTTSDPNVQMYRLYRTGRAKEREGS